MNNDFFSDINFKTMVSTIKDAYASDGAMSVLLDFERCLDDLNVYAYQNWEYGELVAGPEIARYEVSCVFLWPYKLMPDPSFVKRAIKMGCSVHYKRTKIKIPVNIKSRSDFEEGTHYPKMSERDVWLVQLVLPKSLMNDIREGSIDLADEEIDLSKIDDAFKDDMEPEDSDMNEESPDMGMDMGMGMGMGGGMDDGMGMGGGMI